LNADCNGHSSTVFIQFTEMSQMHASIANRLYVNPCQDAVQAGAVCLPFDGNYFPRLDHASYREHLAPRSDAKREHVHDVYHIVLVTGGAGAFVIGGESIPVERGRLFLVSPGETHTFNNHAGESKEYCVVTFEFLNAKHQSLTWPFSRLLSAWVGRPCHPPGNLQAPPALEELVLTEIEQIVWAGFNEKENADWTILRCLWRLLSELGTFFSNALAGASTRTPVQLAKAHLFQNYAERVSLAALARVANLSPNYLTCLFKKEYGMTPIHYQQFMRIQAARALLNSTEYPLKVIAKMVGFEDVYYFSRVFRNIHGQPPGTCRHRQQLRQ
jgi:AraC-like DNA-binding protein/mannose-6-phosphate isomerase-like protein (cupin superfamily)